MGLIQGTVLSIDEVSSIGKVLLAPGGKTHLTVGRDQGSLPGGEASGTGRAWGGDHEGIPG